MINNIELAIIGVVIWIASSIIGAFVWEIVRNDFGFKDAEQDRSEK